jgi:hypothetical protein
MKAMLRRLPRQTLSNRNHRKLSLHRRQISHRTYNNNLRSSIIPRISSKCNRGNSKASTHSRWRFSRLCYGGNKKLVNSNSRAKSKLAKQSSNYFCSWIISPDFR